MKGLPISLLIWLGLCQHGLPFSQYCKRCGA
jgi:hypothetical protein